MHARRVRLLRLKAVAAIDEAKILRQAKPLHDALAKRLTEIPVQPSSRYGPITCRVWVKEALEELDNEGYIKLQGKVNDIEQEAIDEAVGNKLRRKRTTIKSKLSAA